MLKIVGVFFFQTLFATLKGKKADAGPWIDILTSRDPDHLNKGEAVMYFSSVCANVVIPLTSSVIGSADGSGAGVRTDGGPAFREKVFRRHSTGSESFR